MKLVIERGKVWEVEGLAPKTIALDGAVQGPYIDTAKEIYSFDHHANCLRLVTKATCAQVYDALLLGLNPDGFTVLINDVDGDTVLSYWLLWAAANFTASDLSSLLTSDFMKQLVEVVSNVDAHGPAYPLTEKQEWFFNQFYKGVMAPEAKARYVDRNYGTVDLKQLLSDCILIMMKLWFEKEVALPAKQEKTDSYFTVTHKANNFVMVESNDVGFKKCYEEGYKAAILYSKLPDGSIAYTVGKKSEFVAGFNVPKVLAALNAVEPGWGGGSTIGGAPRNPDGSRSHLTPDEVFNIVKGV